SSSTFRRRTRSNEADAALRPVRWEGPDMKVVIRLSAKQEAKALPILLRHSPGAVLPDRTYVISEGAAKALHEAGIDFDLLSREADAPGQGGLASREEI